jgi:hypothetical protein
MYLTPVDPVRRLVTAIIAIVIIGIMLFLYGMFLESPALISAFLSLQASLLEESVTTRVLEQSMPGVPDQLFMLASVLIIAGAALDVWRRLHLEHSHPLSNDPFEVMGHDRVLEEPHIL